MKTYSVASERLGARDSRKVGNNTYLQRRGEGVIALRLHATDVVTWYDNGRTVLNSGGWRTVTTKARINEWAPAYIVQRGGVWYVDGGATVYADGMTVDETGAVLAGAGAATTKADKANKTRIKAYAQACADAVPMEAPSEGDCWFCLFPMPGVDHLDSHMSEAYIVPSLVLRALRAAGNTDTVIAGAFQDAGGFFTEVARERTRSGVTRYMQRAYGFAG